MKTQLPTSGHAHQHICYFSSCRFPSCLAAQADSLKYGFTDEGEINLPEKVRLPWES